MYAHHHTNGQVETTFVHVNHEVYGPAPDTTGAHSVAGPSAASANPLASGTDFIDRPIHFVAGQFAGHTIRAELFEVQKADLGRKYARVDRRPIDPPPAVQLRLHHVYNAGTDKESEKEVPNYDEVEIAGFMCTVDLFPVPSLDAPHKSAGKEYSPDRQPFAYVQPQIYSPSPSVKGSDNNGSSSPAQFAGFGATSHSETMEEAQDQVVHYFEGFPIRESSKLTSSLVGATFVQPSNVEYKGQKCIMFVFADLAVKAEGRFILRYRVFDLFSRAQDAQLLIQAQCYGGAFRVYSTKEFPRLQPSTELTKQLARFGVRLNVRETERRRRGKGTRSMSPPFSTTRMQTKRKQPNALDESEENYPDDDDTR